MTVQVLAPRDVQTTLNYYQSKDAQPPSRYYYIGEPPAGVPTNNIATESHPAIIHDARGKQDGLGLDIGGFQWVTYPSVEEEFVDEETVKTVYYAEVEDVLKKHTGAERVFILTAPSGGARIARRRLASRRFVVWQPEWWIGCMAVVTCC